MALYDVDGTTTEHQPSEVEWIPPDYVDGQDGNSSQSIYWGVILRFISTSNILPPEAWDEWAAFNDLVQHTIILPSHDDPETPATYTGAIKIDSMPTYVSPLNPSDFSMKIGLVDVS